MATMTHIFVNSSDYRVTCLEDEAQPALEYEKGVDREDWAQRTDKNTKLSVWEVQAAISFKNEGELVHNGKVKILSEKKPEVGALSDIDGDLRITPWVNERGNTPRVALSWSVIPKASGATFLPKAGEAK